MNINNARNVLRLVCEAVSVLKMEIKKTQS